jgi:hypothetical protein
VGHRRNVYVSRIIPHETLPSPNATVAAVTTEIRLFFPPTATQATLLNELSLAYDEACERVRTEVPDPALLDLGIVRDPALGAPPGNVVRGGYFPAHDAPERHQPKTSPVCQIPDCGCTGEVHS